MTQRERLVQLALGEVGKPYAEHRDCSGLTAWLYRQIGVTIPEGSVAQFGAGEAVRSVDGVRADEPALIHFWDTFGQAPGHVALGIGNGQVVHALNEQRGIVVSSLYAPMGGNGRYMGARRIPVDGASTPVAAPSPAPDRAPRQPRERSRDRRRFVQRALDTIRRRRVRP